MQASLLPGPFQGCEIFVRVEGRARQRRGRYAQEPLGAGDLLQLREFFRCPEPVDGVMFGGGLQVLAHGEEIDIGGAQVVHHLADIVEGLTQADHQAGLGEQFRVGAFGVIQQPQRGVIARAGAHPSGKAAARFPGCG